MAYSLPSENIGNPNVPKNKHLDTTKPYEDVCTNHNPDRTTANFIFSIYPFVISIDNFQEEGPHKVHGIFTSWDFLKNWNKYHTCQK